jgi:sirohydrochlorin cobaltochelatase
LTHRVELDPSRITAVSLTDDDRQAFEAAQNRLRALLPEDYQETYEQIQPVSMGSAGLKYAADGQVAWNEMWATFCDLAMAGGPPHKGALLEPAPRTAVEAAPQRYQDVIDEICRGITMVTDLGAYPAPVPGWVHVDCFSEAMAGWLLRAIVMENVSVRTEGLVLALPAGPDYRLEKEIKNVVTVIAKTCHYWTGHMWLPQRRRIAALLAAMNDATSVVAPALATDGVPDGHDTAVAALAAAVGRDTGLSPSAQRYVGWVGFNCPSVHAALWMMRLLVAGNVLTRREGTALFVPVNPVSDPHGQAIARAVARVHRFAVANGVV